MKTVDMIIECLKNDDWVYDDYTARHVKSGLELWIANIPILDLCVYRPTPLTFSLIDKFRVYHALKDNRKRMIIKALQSVPKSEIEKA